MTSRIIVLDEKVANQIAAGEVIERPASILKELVENSIDAGSTRIQVEVVEGGRTSIRVLDNGEGISREDVLRAFERHATSKIREAADLFSIRTLGFRGEALPSIAAVSKVTLQTRTAADPVGLQVKIEGGEVTSQRDVGMAQGTDFLVEDLFFNTPARLKYLKSTTTELGQISDLFNRIAVAEPQIAMSLTHNGHLVSRTPGTGRLKDVLYTIYGRELMDNLLEVEYTGQYITVNGFVSSPSMYRSSRKHQSFYVNGRFVRSTLLSRAVEEAYSNLLPGGRNPLVFLFVRINPIHVDVNVHPAKFEVRFSRPEIVADVVTCGVRESLLNANLLPTFRPVQKLTESGEQRTGVDVTSLFDYAEAQDENPDSNIEPELAAPVGKSDTGTDVGRDASTISTDAYTDTGIGITSLSPDTGLDSTGDRDDQKGIYNQEPVQGSRVRERLASMNYQAKNWDPLYRDYSTERKNARPATQRNGKTSGEERYPEEDCGEACTTSAATPLRKLTTPPTTPCTTGSEDTPAATPVAGHVESKGPGAFIAGLLPVGQIHQTYIIAQGRDGFYVFDQHVVHERILYEELMTVFRQKGLPSQTLLIPLTLELTLKEIQIIQENRELFDQLGFEIEHFGGNTVMVRAVPRRIDERPDRDLFLEIVDLIIEDRRAGDRAQLYNKLITNLSCKSAIKAGERLEQGEMLQLLHKLSKTENPHFCPHGRPIFFHISEHDLLKAFQRI